MRSIHKILLVILIIGLGIGVFLMKSSFRKKAVPSPIVSQPDQVNVTVPAVENPRVQNASDFQPPLDRARERVTKKPFGLFITPQNSPVQPEKFRGYHTGADFEIFPEELNADVPVRAVCAGKLKAKEYATGYGGVVVQACDLQGQPITVIYGHLKLASVNVAVGTDLRTGDTIGFLGKAYSSETSGERKHLHLGFHKGTSVNILGYVQSKAELSSWIDPCLYVCGQ